MWQNSTANYLNCNISAYFLIYYNQNRCMCVFVIFFLCRSLTIFSPNRHESVFVFANVIYFVSFSHAALSKLKSFSIFQLSPLHTIWTLILNGSCFAQCSSKKKACTLPHHSLLHELEQNLLAAKNGKNGKKGSK